MLVAEFVDGDVVENSAVFVTHGRVAHLTGVHIEDVVDQQPVNEPFGSRPLDIYFAHRRQVLQADVGAGVDVLLDRGGVGQGQRVVAAAAHQLAGRAKV